MISNDRMIEKRVYKWSTEAFLQSYLRGAFASGREALISLFSSKDFLGCTVMLPGFLPQGIIAPLEHLRCRRIYYRIDSYGNPDINHISNLLEGEKPEVFIVIHYFGVKRGIREIEELLDTENTLIIEDFAQSFPDKEYMEEHPDNLFLISLPKLFGIPDGGLILGSQKLATLSTAPRRIGARIYTLLRLLSLSFARPVTARFMDKYFKYLSAALSILSYKLIMRSFTKPSAQSSYSKRLFRSADLRTGIARRSKFAANYYRRLNNKVVSIHPSLNPEKDVLMGFPVYVQDRRTFCTYLLEHGVKPLVFEVAWGYLPKELESSFGETLEFRDKHVLLPLSHHLTERHIDKVIEVVNQYPG